MIMAGNLLKKEEFGILFDFRYLLLDVKGHRDRRRATSRVCIAMNY